MARACEREKREPPCHVRSGSQYSGSARSTCKYSVLLVHFCLWIQIIIWIVSKTSRKRYMLITTDPNSRIGQSFLSHGVRYLSSRRVIGMCNRTSAQTSAQMRQLAIDSRADTDGVRTLSRSSPGSSNYAKTKQNQKQHRFG